MATARLLWVTPLGLILAACASQGPPQFRLDPGAVPRCTGQGNPNDCWVPVTVTATGSGCAISIAAEQQTLHFRRRDSDRGRFIYWALSAPPGYAFAADGIHIANNPNNAGREFDRATLSPDGQTWRVRNRNTRTGDYKYDIRVHSEGAGIEAVQCELDPLIKNE